MTDTLFYLFATGMLILSVLTVMLPNLLHGAIALIGSFFLTAALYILLQLEFVALAQIALYVGGIVVFMLMIILLTNDLGVDDSLSRVSAGRQVSKVLIAFGLLGALFIFFKSNASPLLNTATQKAAPVSIDAIGIRLLSTNNGFIVPFEVVSLLLLAALIGAVVLSRRDPKNEEKKQ